MKSLSNSLKPIQKCFLLFFLMSLSIALAQDSAMATVEVDNAADDITGVWVYHSKKGEEAATGDVRYRLKFIADNHWTITQPDPKTGLVKFHHGGTYTYRDGIYTETIEFAASSTAELISNTFKFKMEVNGNKLTQTGIDNSWHEVWKKVE